MVKKFVSDYIRKLEELLDELSLGEIEKIVDIIFEAYKDDKQVFIMGNGGSASTASHFACDLGKGTIVRGKKRFRVISLNENTSLITALANDFGYDLVFKEQLINLVNPEDVVIVLSASGNSPNVVEAIKYAKSRGAVTIGFIGFDGGKLRGLVNEHILIKANNYGQVEDVHLVLEHVISQYFKEKLEKEA